jgi:hypothetical protein
MKLNKDHRREEMAGIGTAVILGVIIIFIIYSIIKAL